MGIELEPALRHQADREHTVRSRRLLLQYFAVAGEAGLGDAAGAIPEAAGELCREGGQGVG